MAVLKYKNPNYVIGGTEEKYLPLFNVIVGSSEIYIGEEEPTNDCLIWINPTNNITKYKYNDTWIGLINLQETVTISLVSNQDEIAIPDPDLLGKVIHVIYGDQDKELVWQGEAIKTTVPINMTYQVVFPSDDRYKCPAQQEYFALAGNTREVNGLYYTEAVTVNVTCDDNTSAEGQQVTINGTVYDVDTTGSVTAKIPFDVEYTVSVNTKSGYKSPSSVTETANNKTKTISMEYILIVYGVFIEATDGTLHKSTEWTGSKTANSVVVISEEASFRISLPLTVNHKKPMGEKTWKFEQYMTSVQDYTALNSDMKSTENTNNILKVVNNTSYAAGFCNSYIFPDGKTKGVIPAYGWLRVANNYLQDINNCLYACGARIFYDDEYYWSSTFSHVYQNTYRYFWAKALGAVEQPQTRAVDHTKVYARPFAEYN